MSRSSAPSISADIETTDGGSVHHFHAVQWVADAFRGVESSLDHPAPLIIEALVADLSTRIERDQLSGVHIEPVLPQLRDRLRALAATQQPTVIAQLVSTGAPAISCQQSDSGTQCLASANVLSELRGFIIANVFDNCVDDTMGDNSVQDALGALLVEMDRERRKELVWCLQRALVKLFTPDACQQVFDKYIRYLTARGTHYSARPVELQRLSNREIDFWLLEVEKYTVARAVRESKAFRTQVLVAWKEFCQQNGSEDVPYTIHEGLAYGIERFAAIYVGRTFPFAAPEPEKQEKLALIFGCLVSEYGFCSHCAQALIEEAAANENFIPD